MRRSISLAAAAYVAVVIPANAADLFVEEQLGLIVSGVVDSWAGVQFIDDGNLDDTVLASGGEGRLSLPLADNMSIQSDVKYETNEYAFESPLSNDTFGPRYSYQGAVHVSWRDPSAFLIGGFGGAGTYNLGGLGTTAHFVGGEAQFYAGDLTFYGQGGYVSFNPDFNDIALDDGFFARGVVRWFPTPDSRLQLEGTYIGAEYASGNIPDYPDVEVWSVGARYDFMSPVLPLAGSLPLYIAYRGTFRGGCDVFTDVENQFALTGRDIDDHLIMVGTSYSFSGGLLSVDRQGATLDTPNFISCVGAPPAG